MPLDELVQSLLKQLKDMIQTETVIGKPIKVDATTLQDTPYSLRQ